MASDAAPRGSLESCFHEFLVYVVLLRTTCARKQPSAAEVRDNIRDLLHRSAQAMRTLGIDPRDYDEARFAVCAWADEVVLNMPWTYREEWRRYLLQSEHYGTTKAGEEFFDRLNLLRPEQDDVREVFSLCLSLGFIGRYCAPGDEVLLDPLRRSNLKLLARGPLEVSGLAAEPILQDSAGSKSPARGRAPRRFWSLPRVVLAAGAPALGLLLLLVYRFVLNGVVDTLVGRIAGS